MCKLMSDYKFPAELQSLPLQFTDFDGEVFDLEYYTPGYYHLLTYSNDEGNLTKVYHQDIEQAAIKMQKILLERTAKTP